MSRTLTWAATTCIASMIFAAVSFGTESPHHWSYNGSTGPKQWGSLETDFKTCALGKYQSPINIRDDLTTKADLPTIEFAYRSAPLKIIDNGHTIQINYAPGSFVTINGKEYELVQFHFHRPSEERINGKRYDMVAHLVHKDADGKLAVVAVLLTNGVANPFINTLWQNLPKEKEVETAVDSVSINIADLLPKDRAYYTFNGSLTTPPCSEGVTWFVLKHPSSISADQVARFARSYPMNARPVQPLDGREIRASK
jgi:carbonic anhydrase